MNIAGDKSTYRPKERKKKNRSRNDERERCRRWLFPSMDDGKRAGCCVTELLKLCGRCKRQTYAKCDAFASQNLIENIRATHWDNVKWMSRLCCCFVRFSMKWHGNFGWLRRFDDGEFAIPMPLLIQHTKSRQRTLQTTEWFATRLFLLRTSVLQSVFPWPMSSWRLLDVVELYSTMDNSWKRHVEWKRFKTHHAVFLYSSADRKRRMAHAHTETQTHTRTNTIAYMNTTNSVAVERSV